MVKIVAGLVSRKRSDSEKEYLFIEYVKFPGLHGLCGGHVDESESPKKALIREFHEELGVLIFPKNIRHVMKADIKGEIIEIWDCDLEEDNFVLQKEEIASVKWFSSEEVLKSPDLFFPAIYNFFKDELGLLR